MTKRTILLLADPVPLTRRQRAQKKYQQSAKGKAAMARYRGKVANDPIYRAKQSARALEYQRRHATTRRVYKRVWQQTRARLKIAA